MGIGFSFKKNSQKARFNYLTQDSQLNEIKCEDDDLEDAVDLVMTMQQYKQSKSIEFTFSCTDIKNPYSFDVLNTFIAVKLQEPQQQIFKLIDCTEIQVNQNAPQFYKKVFLRYKQEEDLNIRFELYKVKDVLIKSNTEDLSNYEMLSYYEHPLNDLDLNYDYEKKLKNKKGIEDGAKLNFIAVNSDIGSSKTYLQIKLVDFPTKNHIYFTVSGIKQTGSYCFMIHRSQPKKNTQRECVFEEFKIKANQLTKEQDNLKFEFYELRQDAISRLLGELDISIQNLANTKQDDPIEIFKNNLVVGKLKVMKLHRDNQANFFDYMLSGYNIKTIMAIDFSMNTEIQNSIFNKVQNESCEEILEQINKKKQIEGLEQGLDDFDGPIEYVWRVLKNFDCNEETMVLGYGAKMPPSHFLNSNCFSLKENFYSPYFKNYEDIKNAIKEKFIEKQIFKMSQPSIVSDIIKYVNDYAQYAKQEKSKQYIVLVIITKNLPKDLQQLEKEIQKCINLPISIIMYHLNCFQCEQLIQQNNPKWENISDTYHELVEKVKEAQIKKSQTNEQYEYRDVLYWFQQQKLQEDQNNLESFARNLLCKIPQQFLKYMKLSKTQIKVKEKNENIVQQDNRFLATTELQRNRDKKNNLLEEYLAKKKQRFLDNLTSSGFDKDIEKYINDNKLFIYCEEMNIVYHQLAKIIEEKEREQNKPIEFEKVQENFDNLITTQQLYQIKTQIKKAVKKEDLDEKFLIKRDENHIKYIQKNFPEDFYDYYHNIYQKLKKQKENRLKKTKNMQSDINQNEICQQQINQQKKFLERNKICQICYQNKIQKNTQGCGHILLCQECSYTQQSICIFCQKKKNYEQKQKIQPDYNYELSEDNSQSYEEFSSQETQSDNEQSQKQINGQEKGQQTQNIIN